MASTEFLPDGYTLIDVVPLGGAPGAFTFGVPPALSGRVVPGARVIVPFHGRRRTSPKTSN